MDRARGLVYQSRAAATPRRISYGVQRLGGMEAYFGVAGDKNDLLHFILMWGEGPFQSIDYIMLDDKKVYIDANGDAIGDYAGYVHVEHRLGTSTQTAIGTHLLESASPPPQREDYADDMDGLLEFEAAYQAWEAAATTSSSPLPGWESTDKLLGVAHSWVRLHYGDGSKWATGVPSISAVCHCRNDVWDPRDEIYKYTTNVALCFNHYLTMPILGCGCDQDTEIDNDLLIEAANNCDETISLEATFTRICSVDVGNRHIPTDTQLASELSGMYIGMRVSGPGIPDGSVIVSMHPEDGQNFFTIDNVPTSDNFSVELTFGEAEPQYTFNGTFALDDDPEAIIEGFRTAYAGSAVYSAGKWKMYAGVYTIPTFTITKEMIVGAVKIQTKVSKRSHLNTVKGVYVAERTNWQPTDFPAVTNPAYVAEDGEILIDDIDLPNTNSRTMARRIASINLERTRLSRQVNLLCNVEAVRAQPGLPVLFHFPELNFENQPMEVLEYGLQIESGKITIALTLKETSPDVYDAPGNGDDDGINDGDIGPGATSGPPPGGPGLGPDDPPLEYPDIFPPGVAGGISLSFECRSKGYTYTIEGFDEFLVSIPPKRFLQKQSSGSLSWCYYQHPGSVCNAVSEGSFKYDYAEHCTKDPVTLGVAHTGQRTLTAGNTACAFVGSPVTDNNGCGLTGIPGSPGPELNEGLTSTQWTLDGNGICATDFFRIGSGHAEVNLSAEDTDDDAVARAIADGGNVWSDWVFCLGGSSASWEQRGAGQYSASKLDGQIKVTGFVTFPNTTYTIIFSFSRTLIGGDGTIEDAGEASASLSSGTSGEVEGVVDVPTTKGYYTFSTGWRLGSGDE